jgi:hypothetical protein
MDRHALFALVAKLDRRLPPRFPPEGWTVTGSAVGKGTVHCPELILITNRKTREFRWLHRDCVGRGDPRPR